MLTAHTPIVIFHFFKTLRTIKHTSNDNTEDEEPRLGLHDQQSNRSSRLRRTNAVPDLLGGDVLDGDTPLPGLRLLPQPADVRGREESSSGRDSALRNPPWNTRRSQSVRFEDDGSDISQRTLRVRGRTTTGTPERPRTPWEPHPPRRTRRRRDSRGSSNSDTLTESASRSSSVSRSSQSPTLEDLARDLDVGSEWIRQGSQSDSRMSIEESQCSENSSNESSPMV